MDGVLRQAESDQEGLDSQDIFESADDRNRAARIERQWFLAERVGDGLFRRFVSRHIGRSHVGHTAVQELDLHLVMVGHSERRHVFGESNIEENKKMLAAMKHGFTGLLCIGETKEEKGYGIADEVLRTQIKVGLHGIAAEDLDKVWIA